MPGPLIPFPARGPIPPRAGRRTARTADPRTYRYTGSLTTPPGTEGARWNLMTEAVQDVTK